jgi:hypothetical protein
VQGVSSAGIDYTDEGGIYKNARPVLSSTDCDVWAVLFALESGLEYFVFTIQGHLFYIEPICSNLRPSNVAHVAIEVGHGSVVLQGYWKRS